MAALRLTSSSDTPSVRLETVRRLRRLGRKVEDATMDRNRAIIEANRDGLSLREIAELVGISYSGVDKIIRRVDGADVVTVWTTPINFGQQTRYNFAGSVPAHSRVRLVDLSGQTMFTFDNAADEAMPIDNHTYFTDIGAELHDRYRLEVVCIE